jgi:hypothetical protein
LRIALHEAVVWYGTFAENEDERFDTVRCWVSMNGKGKGFGGKEGVLVIV